MFLKSDGSWLMGETEGEAGRLIAGDGVEEEGEGE